MRLSSIISIVVIYLSSSLATSAQMTGTAAMPHVLIYKTRADYRKYVAVQLSADKSKVVSFPDPADVKTGSASLPVLLHKGYLLDKNGISSNTAFIKMTRKEYSELLKAPSAGELYKLIIDKDPVIAIYDCGIRNSKKNSVDQLNQAIDKKQLKKDYKKIK